MTQSITDIITFQSKTNKYEAKQQQPQTSSFSIQISIGFFQLSTMIKTFENYFYILFFHNRQLLLKQFKTSRTSEA
jgi:hypothetical protein